MNGQDKMPTDRPLSGSDRSSYPDRRRLMLGAGLSMIISSSVANAETPGRSVRIGAMSSYPWRAICLLRTSWGGRSEVASGFLVGPRAVLTAAHNLYPRDRRSYPDTVEVIPGADGADSRYGSLRTTRLEIPPQWSAGFGASDDLGVVQIEETIGDRLGWFAMGVASAQDLPGRPVSVTGYPAEMPNQTDVGDWQLWHHAGRVTAASGGRLSYNCQTLSGQSGAPVYLSPRGGLPTAIGVHTQGGASQHSGVLFDRSRLSWIASVQNPSRTPAQRVR